MERDPLHILGIETLDFKNNLIISDRVIRQDVNHSFRRWERPMLVMYINHLIKNRDPEKSICMWVCRVKHKSLIESGQIYYLVTHLPLCPLSHPFLPSNDVFGSNSRLVFEGFTTIIRNYEHCGNQMENQSINCKKMCCRQNMRLDLEWSMEVKIKVVHKVDTYYWQRQMWHIQKGQS